jgi:hypothetical protein
MTELAGVSRQHIQRVIDRWLIGRKAAYVHLMDDPDGDNKELRILVDYPDLAFDKKTVSDRVVANLIRPSGRPRIRFILVDRSTRSDGEHQRIRVLGEKF